MLRHRWILILPITIVLSSRFLDESNGKYVVSNNVISCVEMIAIKFFTSIENLLVISTKESFIAGELIRRIGKRFTLNLAEPKSVNDFSTIHEYVVLGDDPYETVRNMSLNLRGRYVFVTREKPDALKTTALKLFNAGILNVIFVDGSATVFGYEAYPDVRIRVLDRCEIGKFEIGSNLFPSKFADMGKSELKVPVVNTREMEPDIFVTRYEDGSAGISGVGSNLLKLFAEKHNFKVVVFEHFSYGQKYNGTWNGPAAQIVRGDADLTFAGLIPVKVVTEDLDYSDFYRWDAFHFVTNRARRTVSWLRVFKPFSPTVWTCGLLVLIAISCLVYILRRFRFLNIVDEDVDPMNVLRVILNQSVRYPKSSRIRLAFSVLLLYAYLITTCYNSSLVDRLSQPSFGRNLKTLKDLAESKLEIGGIYALKFLFGANGDPVDREIYHRFVNITGRQFWTALAGRDRAVAVYRTAAIRHNWRYRLNESMQANVIEDPIMGLPFMYYTRKGHPILDPLNNFIRHVHSSGLIVKWMSDYNAIKVDEKRGNEAVVLTLDHFAGVFLILVCGHILATLRFFQEIYYL